MRQLLVEMGPLTIVLFALAVVGVALVYWGVLKWLGPADPVAAPTGDVQTEASAAALLVVAGTTNLTTKT